MQVVYFLSTKQAKHLELETTPIASSVQTTSQSTSRLKQSPLKGREYAAKSMQLQGYAKMPTSAVYALSFHAKRDATHVNHSESDILLEYAHAQQLKPCGLGE